MVIKKKKRINLFDVVIILVVVCAAAGLYVLTNKEKVLETKPLVYTIELRSNPIGFSEQISIGDNISDNVKNYNMGKVIDIEVIPTTKLVEDYERNIMADSIVPDTETVLLTIQANVTESASDFKVDGNYVVKVGKEIAAKGKGYAGSGFIVDIQR